MENFNTKMVKKIIFILPLLLLLGCSDRNGREDNNDDVDNGNNRQNENTIVQDSDCSNKETQLEMNSCAVSEADDANMKLEETLNDIKTINQDPLLDSSQDMWLKYQNHFCHLKSKQYDGGSMQPYIEQDCIKDITNIRIEELESFHEDNQR